MGPGSKHSLIFLFCVYVPAISLRCPVHKLLSMYVRQTNFSSNAQKFDGVKLQRHIYELSWALHFCYKDIFVLSILSLVGMVTAQGKTQKCAACYRQVVAKGKKYCIYHTQAYDSLQKQYIAWVNAYGGISQKDYMKKMLSLDETGSWVKDVINIQLRESKKVMKQE